MDECHRSTFGDMLSTIKNTFPEALFFGFTGTPIKEENQKKREELGFKPDDFLMLTVAEMTPNKNHITALKAIEKLKGTAEYDRVLSKLNGTFEGPDLTVDYSNIG